MRALVTSLLLLAMAAPAFACPPMKLRRPVDPVVALQERVDEVTAPEEIAEIVKSAHGIARQRSRSPEQRARALAVVAAGRTKLGDARGATLALARAKTLEASMAPTVAVAP